MMLNVVMNEYVQSKAKLSTSDSKHRLNPMVRPFIGAATVPTK